MKIGGSILSSTVNTLILHIAGEYFDFIYQFQHVLFTGSHDKFKRICRGDHKYYYQCGGMYHDHTGSILPGSVSIQQEKII